MFHVHVCHSRYAGCFVLTVKMVDQGVCQLNFSSVALRSRGPLLGICSYRPNQECTACDNLKGRSSLRFLAAAFGIVKSTVVDIRCVRIWEDIRKAGSIELKISPLCFTEVPSREEASRCVLY